MSADDAREVASGITGAVRNNRKQSGVFKTGQDEEMCERRRDVEAAERLGDGEIGGKT